MRTDIKLSQDGDLVLGQQRTDDEGYLMYYEDYNNNGGDVHLTREASDTSVPVRQLDMAYDTEADLQLIKARLQTDNPDWALYPAIGASLSDLIGELNNEATAQVGISRITNALTKDGAFSADELEVDAAPVGPDEVLFDIRLRRDMVFVRYALIFNFDTGLMNAFEL